MVLAVHIKRESNNMALVDVKDLTKYFPVKRGIFSRGSKMVHAVDGVSFFIKRGETLGLVGESGCGKTTIARLILRLVEPTKGTVLFEGRNIFNLKKEDLRRLRREMQIIFQNPFASLNPRRTIYHILAQPYLVHNTIEKDELENNVLEMLETVNLTPPHQFIERYPHELSGGQRQRIVIARAITLKPKFVVADEPVSSLDVSIRAQMLNLMKQLQKKYLTTTLFITHDLSVIRSITDRVSVMHLGKIVETARTDDLFKNPLHPYTSALLSAVPIPDPKITRNRRRIVLKGEVSTPIDLPPGCRFRARCPYAMPKCARAGNEPNLNEIEPEHSVACHILN